MERAAGFHVLLVMEKVTRRETITPKNLNLITKKSIGQKKQKSNFEVIDLNYLIVCLVLPYRFQ